MAILRIEGLTKHFRTGLLKPTVKALEDLNLEVEEGEIFGFLGPNGAGKTTTIKLLLRLLYPTRGTAYIRDIPIEDNRARRHLGYMPENAYFYRFLTGGEFLNFYGRLHGMRGSERDRKTRELLKIVGMSHARKTPIGEYSKGMTQRIGLAQSVLSDPDLVLMDEPLSGVDPIGRAEIRDQILALREKGMTILFCSHILADVESICDRVAILNKGRLLKLGRLTDLIHQRGASYEVQIAGAGEDQMPEFSEWSKSQRHQGGILHLVVEDEERVAAILDKVHGTALRVVSIQERRENLETYFMRLIEEAKES